MKGFKYIVGLVGFLFIFGCSVLSPTFHVSSLEESTVRIVYTAFNGSTNDKGCGSGTIISSDGYILTANHVVNRADNIIVTLQDGSEHPAQIVKLFPKKDAAVIKIFAGDGLKPVKLGDSRALKAGDTLYTIGNVACGGILFYKGIFSGNGDGKGLFDGESLMTDSAHHPGMSGGGIFNVYGEQVGIISGLWNPYGVFNIGLGIGVPINAVKYDILGLMQLRMLHNINNEELANYGMDM